MFLFDHRLPIKASTQDLPRPRRMVDTVAASSPGFSLLDLPMFAHAGPCVPVPSRYHVGAADDPREREADEIARDIVGSIHTSAYGGASASNVPSPLPPGRISRDATPGAAALPVPAALAAELEAGRSGGSPLPATLRVPLERTVGRPLDHLRVHTDQRANALNDALDARAFATGSDLFFRSGEFQPNSPAGQKLIAHEVAHTLQGGDTIRRTVIYGGTTYHSQGKIEMDDADALIARLAIDGKILNPYQISTLRTMVNEAASIGPLDAVELINAIDRRLMPPPPPRIARAASSMSSAQSEFKTAAPLTLVNMDSASSSAGSAPAELTTPEKNKSIKTMVQLVNAGAPELVARALAASPGLTVRKGDSAKSYIGSGSPNWITVNPLQYALNEAHGLEQLLFELANQSHALASAAIDRQALSAKISEDEYVWQQEKLEFESALVVINLFQTSPIFQAARAAGKLSRYQTAVGIKQIDVLPTWEEWRAYLEAKRQDHLQHYRTQYNAIQAGKLKL